MKKTWKNPEIKELGINMTEMGPHITDSHDEVYVDENGDKWYTHASS